MTAGSRDFFGATVLLRLFISHIPQRDHLVAVEFGRSPDGQLPGAWRPVGEDAAFLHDGPGGPVVGFGVEPFSTIDLEDPTHRPLWEGPRFAAPLLGLLEASAAEIIIAARAQLGGRRTLNRQIFDAAVDARARSRWLELQLWQDCLDCGDATAQFGVGCALYELGRFRDAYRHLRHYAEIAPGNPWNWRWYGRAAESIDEVKEAVLAYERAVDLGGEETDAETLLEVLYEREGEIDLRHADLDDGP